MRGVSERDTLHGKGVKLKLKSEVSLCFTSRGVCVCVLVSMVAASELLEVVFLYHLV